MTPTEQIPKKYGYFLLSFKSYPSDVLKQKLSDINIDPKIIDAVIVEFTHLGYLKDKEWIEAFIESELNRGWGPQIILWKLKQKNIQTYLELVQKIATIEKQKASIQKYLQKNPKKNLFSNLTRRGFDFCAIQDWQES